jgi:hypothetical protein
MHKLANCKYLDYYHIYENVIVTYIYSMVSDIKFHEKRCNNFRYKFCRISTQVHFTSFIACNNTIPVFLKPFVFMKSAISQ